MHLRYRLIALCALALIALCALAVSGCVLPGDFRDQVDEQLDRAVAGKELPPFPGEPTVSHTALPFADPIPRVVEPAWLSAPIDTFQSDAANSADLLRLAASAAGVYGDLQLSRLPPVTAVRFAGGTAAQLMQTIADSMGLFWDAQPGRVVFADTRTRVFELSDFRDRDYDEGVGLQTQLASEQSSESRNTSESEQQRWQNLVSRVQLLAGEQAKVMASPAPGTLTVRASPNGMRAVEDYLAELNRRLSRQVELDVKLLQISLSDSRSIGLDWSAVRQSLLGSTEISSDASLDRGLSVRAERRDSTERTALFRAFADQGSVRLLTNPRGVTLNGRPIDIALVTQTAYLARIVPGTAGGLGGQAEAGLEPGIVESGFVLEVLPKVQGNNVLLRLRARLSSLQELSQIRSGERSIQVPTLSESRFSHWAKVASGDTLILGGVRQLRSDSSFALSPERTSVRERTEQVLLITPRIL